MSVNLGYAHASNDFLIAALLIYSLAVIAFAGDYAFGRPRRVAAAVAKATVGAKALATVGAHAGVADGEGSVAGDAPAAPPATPPAAASRPQQPAGAFRDMWEAGPWIRVAVGFSALGALTHLVAVVTGGSRYTAPRGATCTSSSRP